MTTDTSTPSFIESTIKEYIMKEIWVDPGLPPVGDDTKLIESGVLDSLSLLKLVTFIEERFDVKVAADEIVPDNFNTLGTIRDYVLRKKA